MENKYKSKMYYEIDENTIIATSSEMRKKGYLVGELINSGLMLIWKADRKVELKWNPITAVVRVLDDAKLYSSCAYDFRHMGCIFYVIGNDVSWATNIGGASISIIKNFEPGPRKHLLYKNINDKVVCLSCTNEIDAEEFHLENCEPKIINDPFNGKLYGRKQARSI